MLGQVAVDSRVVEPGGVFYALGGERTDGHQFLPEVAARGARTAVVAQRYDGPAYGMDLVRAPDVLAALQEAARERFARLSGQVVAVTGSMGKTTTKEFARRLVQGAWATPGNQNSQIGLPLAILNLRDDPRVVILEMGMTAPGHIRRLVELFPPDLAMVISVARVHAEAFSSLGAIAQAKSEIFCAPRTQLALMGCGGLEARCRAETFSLTDPQAVFHLDQQGGLFERGQAVGYLDWHLPARHQRHSFLAAAAIARRMGESWEAIISRAGTLEPVAGRFCLEMIRGITVIDDTYNANETSVCAALASLPRAPRRIAVLGPMEQHDRVAHERVAQCALDHVELLLCVGQKTRSMAHLWLGADRRASWFATTDELADAVRAVARPGDVALFKASRAFRLERVIHKLRAP